MKSCKRKEGEKEGEKSVNSHYIRERAYKEYLYLKVDLSPITEYIEIVKTTCHIS